MRVVLRIVSWFAGILFVLAAGTVVYLRNADLSVYEESVEKLLSAATGLDVDFEDDFRLRVGRASIVTVGRIRVKNPGYAASPELVGVDDFRLAINTWSLIRGPIVVEELAAGAATVDLRRGEDGRANWQAGSSSPAAGGGPVTPPELPVFHEVTLSSVDLRFDDARRAVPIELSLRSVQVVPDDQGVLGLSADGEINDYPLSVSGQVGPLPALLEGRDVAGHVRASLGELELDISGAIDDVRRLEGVDATVTLRGPRAEAFTERFGLPPLAEGAFALAGEIHRLQGFQSIRLAGNVGRISIDIDGSVSDFRRLDVVDFDYAVAAPESEYVARVFGLDDPVRTAFRISGGMRRDGGRVDVRETSVAIGRSRINVDGWLRKTDGVPDFSLTLDGTGPDLSAFEPLVRRQGIPREAFSVAGRFMKEGSALRFEDVDLRLGANAVTASGQVEGRGNPDNRIEIRAVGPDLSVFREVSGVTGLPARPFDVRAALQGGTDGVRIQSAAARFGDNVVHGTGLVALESDWAGTRIEFQAEGPDLRAVPVFAGIPYLPSEAFALGGLFEIDRRRLAVSGLTGHVGGLRFEGRGRLGRNTAEPQYESAFAVSGSDIARDLPIGALQSLDGMAYDISGKVAGVGSRLSIENGRGSLGHLGFRVDGSFDVAEPLASDHLNVELAAPDAEPIRALAGLDYLPAGAFRVTADVDSSTDRIRFNDVSVHLGDISLELQGDLDRSRPFSGRNVRLHAAGSSFQQLGLVFNDPYLADEPFVLDALFDGTERGIDMKSFAFSVGESAMSGSMSADFSADTPALSIRVVAPRLDLRDRVRKAIDELQAQSGAAVSVRHDQARFFPSTPLELDWLAAIDLDLEFAAERIVTQTGNLTDVRINVDLVDGNLVLDPLSGRSERGGIDGKLTLTQDQGRVSIDALLVADDMRLPVLAVEGLDPQTIPPVDLDVRLSGEGVSQHDILADANGYVFIHVGAGQAPAFGSRFLTGPLGSAILTAIVPVSERRKVTNVNCGVADVDIVGGLATLRQVAIQSDLLTTLVSGTLDLDTERLQLAIRTQPREGLGIPSLAGVINPFVRVAGTLASPALEIDPAGSLTSTGVAVATGGLSVLARGLWDRLRGGADLCRSLPTERPAREGAED